MLALYSLSASVTVSGVVLRPIRPVDLAGMMLALGLLGAALGQAVRQAKRVCREYAARAALIEGIDGVAGDSGIAREARTAVPAPEGEG
jgi:hypothetical protein